MIKIKISNNSISLKGHANFENYGKDIVCAAVSSLVTCTVNNIYTVNKDALSYNDDGKTIYINVLNDELCLKLLNNLKEMLISLEKDYPKNIMIESEE